MQLHHPHEHTGKENSNLHSCEVSFGCQQFRECIEIFKLTGDILLNFISQCLCVTFSSRSVHFTDWNAQTLIHLSISKEQIIIMILGGGRIVSELSNIPFCFFCPCPLPLHNPSFPLSPHSSPPGPCLLLLRETCSTSGGSLLNPKAFDGESASQSEQNSLCMPGSGTGCRKRGNVGI